MFKSRNYIQKGISLLDTLANIPGDLTVLVLSLTLCRVVLHFLKKDNEQEKK